MKRQHDPLTVPCDSIRNARLELSWSAQGLALTDISSGRFIFRHATVRIADYAGNVHSLFEDQSLVIAADHANKICLRGTLGALAIELRFVLDNTCLRCAMRITNHGAQAFQLGDVDILCFDRAVGGLTHLLADPFQVFSLGAVTGESELMWSKEPRNKKIFALTVNRADPHYASDNIFCARPVTARNLTPEVTFSFDRIGEAACGVVVDLDEGISRVRAAFRGATLPAGEAREIPSLFVDGISPAHEAIEAAVNRVAAIYPSQLTASVPRGWCSWYYYYTSITEEAILGNLCFLSKHRDRLPVEYVQIDDGYQRHWGDWLLPSGKFPHDMAWLAREIKALGFKPGIWVAPLIMTVQSNLFKSHPDWALRRFETGEPYTMEGWSPEDENPWVLLDGTNPEFLAHLKAMFTVMAHEWGYDYFKLDAMGFGGYAGVRYRQEMTGEQTLRHVLETVREAIGPDKYILGCGVPFGAAVGVVNGERVSDDVSTAFRREQFVCPMEVSLPQSIHRSFIHGKWWHNDPDCVLVRRDGTPHQTGLDQFGLSLEEARFFVTVVGLTQGIQMIGENMLALDEERLALLETIQPPMPAQARPLDLYASQPERLLTVTSHGILLGLLNWGRESKRFAFPVAELNLDPAEMREIYELWTDQHLQCSSLGLFEIEVPAQGSRLLFLRPSAPHPMFLGFGGHLSCGAALLDSEEWSPATQTLHLKFQANRSGILHLTAPAGWTTQDSSLHSSGQRDWTVRMEKGMHRLSYRFQQQ